MSSRPKPKTKAGKRRKAAMVMREFEAGTLKHGSTGETVTRPAVAKAIAMSASGQSKRKKRRGKRTT